MKNTTTDTDLWEPETEALSKPIIHNNYVLITPTLAYTLR